MKKRLFLMMAAILTFCGTVTIQAQVMKSADLEKYAKQKYGDKWLDAAANLAKGLTLDKNESLTYQQIIESPGKSKQQLYVALNYWVTATFKDKQAITLNDKEAGCIIVTASIVDIARHVGTVNKYSVSIAPVIRLDTWLQSPSAVILEPRKIKSDTVYSVSPSIPHEVMGPDPMIFVF